MDVNNRPKSMSDFESQFEMDFQEEIHGTEYQTTLDLGVDDIQKDSEQEINSEYDELEKDGPTIEDIELWKKQYPNSKIYRTVIVDDVFIYRTINRVEYKNLVARNDLNALTREEQMCRLCCLFPQLTPQLIGESGAGSISSLAQTIMKTSGFVEPEEVERLA